MLVRSERNTPLSAGPPRGLFYLFRDPADCNLSVGAVNLYTDAPAREALGGDQGRPRPEKRIEHRCALYTVELDATLRQLDREPRRVVMLMRPGLHGLVRDEPHVSRTAPILRVTAPRDVRFEPRLGQFILRGFTLPLNGRGTDLTR
jgi:hypothetical protein